MGIIRAAIGSVTGTLSDQFLDDTYDAGPHEE